MDAHQVEIRRGDPLDVEAEGLIHPTTCTESPAGDWHEEILRGAGERILRELQSKQPLRIGNVLVTSGGDLPHEKLVHLPVQTAPDVPTTPRNIQVALRSGLVAVDEPSVRRVVLPRPIPNNQEELSLEEVASTLVEDLLQYPPRHFRRILLVDRDEAWIDVLRFAHPGVG